MAVSGDTPKSTFIIIVRFQYFQLIGDRATRCIPVVALSRTNHSRPSNRQESSCDKCNGVVENKNKRHAYSINSTWFDTSQLHGVNETDVDVDERSVPCA